MKFLYACVCALLGLSIGACGSKTESHELPSAISSRLTERPIDFPELICRDEQGTGANVYPFRISYTYSQIFFFENNTETHSQFQEQDIDFDAATISFWPADAILRYGQKPYVFERKGASYTCIEGKPFGNCENNCDRPPVP